MMIKVVNTTVLKTTLFVNFIPLQPLGLFITTLLVLQRKAFIELLKLLGIKLALSMAYHPQTDGTTERVNQEIKAYLSIYCASHPEDWPQALHTLEFTHNN